MTHRLAQANFATMRAPLDDPLMAEFAAQLDPVNALAEASPGFVWRLQTEEGDATAIRAFDNDFILFNMSVWETVEALHDYVYRGHHLAVFRDRKRWFEPQQGTSQALWWVPAGHQPTVLEAKERIEILDRRGPGPEAFTFKERFPQPR